MEDFKLPPKWIGIMAPSRWLKPFGLFHRRTRMIEVYPVAWIPPWFGLRQYFARVTWNHEVLHAWGSPGCRSLWCLGYEHKRSWMEWLAMPVQLLCGLRFCEYCLSWYLAINRKE